MSYDSGSLTVTFWNLSLLVNATVAVISSVSRGKGHQLLGLNRVYCKRGYQLTVQIGFGFHQGIIQQQLSLSFQESGRLGLECLNPILTWGLGPG